MSKETVESKEAPTSPLTTTTRTDSSTELAPLTPEPEITPNAILSSKIEFRDIIQKFRGIEQDWKQKRVHGNNTSGTSGGGGAGSSSSSSSSSSGIGGLSTARESAITKLRPSQREKPKVKVSAAEAAFMTERDQMTETIQTLSKEVANLKSQNEELCIKMEQLKDVLKQSKNYCKSLNQQVQDMASDMQFQSELHQQERQVWKRSAQKSRKSTETESDVKILKHLKNITSSEPTLEQAQSIEMEINDVGDALAQFKQIIVRQKEEIKYKTEQLAHKEQIHAAAIEQIKKELIQELQRVKSQAQVEIEEIKMQMETAKVELNSERLAKNEVMKALEQSRQEIQAQSKAMEMEVQRLANINNTNNNHNNNNNNNNDNNNNGSNADSKINEDYKELQNQLYILEKNYMQLTDTCNNLKTKEALFQKEREEWNRSNEQKTQWINEQKLVSNELKESIKILQQQLLESRNDRNDLIEALQRQWEQSKQEVIVLKEEVAHYKEEIEKLTINNKDLMSEPTEKEIQALQEKVAEIAQLKQQIEDMKKTMNMNTKVRKLTTDIEPKHRLPPQSGSFSILPFLGGDGGAGGGSGGENNSNEIVVDCSDIIRQHYNGLKLNGEKMLQEFDEYLRYVRSKTTGYENVDGGASSSSSSTSASTSTNAIENSSLLFSDEQKQKGVVGVIEGLLLSRKEIIDKLRKTRQDYTQLQQEMIEMNVNWNNQINAHVQDKASQETKYHELKQENTRINGLLEKYKNEMQKMQAEYAFQHQEQTEVMSKHTKERIESLEKEVQQLNDIHKRDINIWRSEKAEIESEKVAFENELRRMVNHLDEIMTERQQFEYHCERWQNMYYQLLEAVHEKGLDVSISMPVDQNMLVLDDGDDQHDEDVTSIETTTKSKGKIKTKPKPISPKTNISPRKTIATPASPKKINTSIAASPRRTTTVATASPRKTALTISTTSRATSPGVALNLTDLDLDNNEREMTPDDDDDAKKHDEDSDNDNEFAMKTQARKTKVTSFTESTRSAQKKTGRVGKTDAVQIDQLRSNQNLIGAPVTFSKSLFSSPSSSAPGSPLPSNVATGSPSAGSRLSAKSSFDAINSSNAKKDKHLVFSSAKLEASATSSSLRTSAFSVDVSSAKSRPKLPKGRSIDTEFSVSESHSHSEVGTVDEKKHSTHHEDEDKADVYILFDEPDEFNFLEPKYRAMYERVLEEQRGYDLTYASASLFPPNSKDNINSVQVSVAREIEQQEKSLVQLQGWLDKKSPHFTKGWQRRWFVVFDYNLLYSKDKKHMELKDLNLEKISNKFLNVIPLVVVQYIVQTDPQKTGRRFEVVARDPRSGDRRHYQFRATTREECTYWVDGLNAHRNLLLTKLAKLAQMDS